MTEPKPAPLPGWYGDGLVRWWNGRNWENRYEPAPKPIVPVKQLPRWVPPLLAVVGIVAAYLVYELTPLHLLHQF